MSYFDIVLEEKKQEGVNTSKMVIKALRAGQPVESIAQEVGLSLQEVTEIKTAMGL